MVGFLAHFHIFSHFVYPSVDVYIWLFPIFSVMNMMLRTFVYEFLSGHLFYFFLGVYLGVELLACIVSPCLASGGIARLFFQSGYISTV